MKTKIIKILNKIACKLDYHEPDPYTIHTYHREGFMENEALCKHCQAPIYNIEKTKRKKQ